LICDTEYNTGWHQGLHASCSPGKVVYMTHISAHLGSRSCPWRKCLSGGLMHACVQFTWKLKFHYSRGLTVAAELHVVTTLPDYKAVYNSKCRRPWGKAACSS